MLLRDTKGLTSNIPYLECYISLPNLTEIEGNSGHNFLAPLEIGRVNV